MHYFSNFKGLSAQAYKMGLLRVVVSMGTMTFAFSSLIFTGILGLSEFTASILAMLLSFCNAAGTIIGGKAADAFGRRKSYMFFSWCACVTMIISGLCCRRFILIPFLFLSNACSNAFYPSLSALVSDNTDDSDRVASFSFIYLCANLGFAVGPSIGGMIFYDHMEWCYYIQAAVYFLGGLYMAFFVKDEYVPARKRKECADRADEQDGGPDYEKTGRGSEIKEESTWALLRREKPVFIFIIALVVLTMCYQLINFTLPLQMTEDFGLEISSKCQGRIWTVNGLVIVLVGPLALNFVKRHHQFVNVIYGSALYAAGFALYKYVRTPALYLASAVVWTLGEIVISTGAGAFIAQNSPQTHRGRFQSFYETGRLIGRAVAPPLFTIVVQFTGHRNSWLVSAAVCVLVGLWLLERCRAFGFGKKAGPAA